MGQGEYKVVLTGAVVEGFDREQVVASAAKIFKCPVERAERFLLGKATTLKRDMDAATAERYRDHLAKAGIACRLESISAPQPVLELSEDIGVSPAPDRVSPSLSLSPTGEEQPANSSGSGATPSRSIESPSTSGNPPVAAGSGFQCPKCGTSQERGEECIKCGIIFSRHQASEDRTATASSQEEPEMNEWDEIGLFVGENMEKYQFKFRQLYQNDGKYQASWHWPAFIAPIPWMIYRKLYPWAAGLLVLQMVLPPMALLIVGISMGLMGNYLYYRHIIHKLGKMTSRGDSRREEIIHAGGRNSMIITIGGAILAGFLMMIAYYLFFMPPEVKEAMEQGQRNQQEIVDVGDDPTKQQMLMLKNILLMQKSASKLMNRDFEMPRDMEELRKMTGMKPKATTDKWGTQMEFEVDGNTMVFYSAGEDKSFDSADDIVLETSLE